MKKTRHVAFVLGNLEFGGAERQALELARHLPAHGWRPVFLLAENHGSLIPLVAETGSRIYDLGAEFSRPKYSPGFWTNLRATIYRAQAIMDNEQCLVAQSFLFWQDIIAVPAARKSSSVAAIITSRRNAGMFKDKRWHYGLVDRLLSPKVDAVVCNSESVRDVNLKRENIDPAKMRVIHNGVDFDRFADATPVSFAEEFPLLAGAKPLLLMIGGLKHEKRHDIFCEAFARVRGELPDAKALIIGRDLGLRAKIEQRIRALNIQDAVVLAGEKSNPENYLAAADIFVLTSENEGFPNVVLEAMAAGKPVVSTSVAGAKEAVIPGETGTLVPVDDVDAIARAIVDLGSAPTLIQSMGAAARQRVRDHFDLQSMAAKYAALYEELLAKRQ